MVKGIVQIVILSAIIVLMKMGFDHLGMTLPFGEKFYPIFIFFFLQSIAVHSLFILGKSQLNLSVQLLVMATMTVRLLSALVAVLIFVQIGVNDIMNFVITFFSVYLVYFVFEITTVLSNLRSNSK